MNCQTILEERSDGGSNVYLEAHLDVYSDRWSVVRLDVRILNSDIQCYVMSNVQADLCFDSLGNKDTWCR